VKILEARINAFGKLENIDYDFDQGMNCIFEDNEYGKSTLMAFVRAMLFGFPPRSSVSVRDYGRQKYKPWSGSAMGGALGFAFSGKQYLLRRRFGERRSEDEIELIDVRSGTHINTGGEEVGPYLFGISEQEFVHTVFIGQMLTDFSQSKQLMSIADRLTGLSAVGDESNSYEVVSRRIDDAMKALRNKRGGGRISELSTRVAELDKLERAAIETLDRVAAFDTEKKQLVTRISLLEHQIRAARIETARMEVSNTRALIQDKNAVSEQQDQKVSTYLFELEQEILTLQENEKEAFSQLEEIHKLKIQPHTESYAVRNHGRQTSRQSVKNTMVAIAAVILSIMSIWIWLDWAFIHAIRQPVLLLLWLPTVLVWGIFYMIRVSERRTARSLQVSFEKEAAEYADKEKSARLRMAAIQERLSDARHNREAFLIQVAKLNATREAEIQVLNHRLSELEHSISEDRTLPDNDLGALHPTDSEAVEKLLITRFEWASRISNIDGATDSLRSMIPDLSAIREEARDLKEKILEAELYYQALEIAKNALEEAAEEMRSVFAPPVREKAGEYLAILTDGRYTSVSFDRDFRVRAGDSYLDEKSADYYSAGTLDQIYLALRLAIADVILEQYPDMPIFLDDALVQYDYKRAKSAVGMLRAISERRQIILLTCHKHIADLCDFTAEK